MRNKVEDHYWIADNLQKKINLLFVLFVLEEKSQTHQMKKEVDQTQMETLAVMESSLLIPSLITTLTLMHAFIPIHGYVSPSIRPHKQSSLLASPCTHVFDRLFVPVCSSLHSSHTSV